MFDVTFCFSSHKNLTVPNQTKEFADSIFNVIDDAHKQKALYIVVRTGDEKAIVMLSNINYITIRPSREMESFGNESFVENWHFSE